MHRRIPPAPRRPTSTAARRALLVCTVAAVIAAAPAACGDGGPGRTVAPRDPRPTTYVAFDGTPLPRTAWPGERVAFLTRRADLDPAVMRRLLETFDAVDAFYATTTGRRPAPGTAYAGRTAIADVPATCGAGCAYLGAAGIELQSAYFDRLYDGVAARNEYDQVLFYEFGRNYWFWSPQLAYRAPDDGGSVVTGYAVFMRFVAMEAAGVAGARFNGHVPFGDFRAEVEGMLDRYLADPALRWENTLRVGRAPTNPLGLGATDLLAAFLFRLRRDHGGDVFVRRLWAEVARRPVAATTQEAVDNFVLAASAAAGRDLVPQFEAWRWPVSAAARAEARGALDRAPNATTARP